MDPNFTGDLSNTGAITVLSLIALGFRWWISRDFRGQIIKQRDALNKELDDFRAQAEGQRTTINRIDMALIGYDQRSGMLADLIELKRKFGEYELSLEEKLRDSRHSIKNDLAPQILELSSELAELRGEITGRIDSIERQMTRFPFTQERK